MTVQTPETSVRTSIIVEAPIERAFEIFTAEMGSWWPSDHHLLAAPLAAMEFEPFVGGHIIDRGVDGSESRWARVLIYEPPHRLVFSWDISLAWQIETNPDMTSEVYVSFSVEGSDQTRVELEHRHIDRHGEGWEQMRAAVGSANGWDLQPFADAARAG